MASSARIFFAGVGTTFGILGIGFGGGTFIANSALKEPTYQARAAERPSPIRVILPASAEAAQPPQPQMQQLAAVEPEIQKPESVKPVPEKRIQEVDTKKAKMEVRERRKRYAERKAKREAAQARRQVEPREQAAVMAFGGVEPHQSFNLFGN
jgi:type IV secretory pathway VirB10-like protein